MLIIRRLLSAIRTYRTKLYFLTGVLICVFSVAPWAYGSAYFTVPQIYIPGVLHTQGQITLVAGLVITWAALRYRNDAEMSTAAVAILAVCFALVTAIAISTLRDPSFLRMLPSGGRFIEGWETFRVSPSVWLLLLSGIFGLAACTVTRLWATDGSRRSLHPSHRLPAQ